MNNMIFDGAVKYDGERWDEVSALLTHIRNNKLDINKLVEKHTSKSGRIFKKDKINWVAVELEAKTYVGWTWDTFMGERCSFNKAWVDELETVRSLMFTSNDCYITPRQSKSLAIALEILDERMNSL